MRQVLPRTSQIRKTTVHGSHRGTRDGYMHHKRKVMVGKPTNEEMFNFTCKIGLPYAKFDREKNFITRKKLKDRKCLVESADPPKKSNIQELLCPVTAPIYAVFWC